MVREPELTVCWCGGPHHHSDHHADRAQRAGLALTTHLDELVRRAR